MDGWGEKPHVKNGPSLGGYGAVAMNAALTASITSLPEQLRKTLTWDRGKELSGHAQFALETGTRVFFADPRGSARRTRTPTAYCGSTCPKAPTCRAGPPKTSRPSLTRSTTGPARSSAGRPPPKSSKSNYARFNKPVLHRPIELATYTSWVFGHRLREAGFLGSMGSTGDCFGNSVVESFFATLQTELLDRSTWPTREGLANASSPSSRASTTRPDATPRWATSAPPTTSPELPSAALLDPPPRTQHDHTHPTLTVRGTGGTSLPPRAAAGDDADGRLQAVRMGTGARPRGLDAYLET